MMMFVVLMILVACMTVLKPFLLAMRLRMTIRVPFLFVVLTTLCSEVQ